MKFRISLLASSAVAAVTLTAHGLSAQADPWPKIANRASPQIVLDSSAIARAAEAEPYGALAPMDNAGAAQIPVVDPGSVERPDLDGPPAGQSGSRALSAAERRQMADAARLRLPGQRLDQAQVRALVIRIARDLQFDDKFAIAVAEAESQLDPFAVSETGAIGVMQLMPATAEELGVADSFDAEANIRGGVRYLKELAVELKHPLLVAAAYNAGRERVLAANGNPTTPRTAAYVVTVLNGFYNLMSEVNPRLTEAAPAKPSRDSRRDARYAAASPAPARISAHAPSTDRTQAVVGTWERGFVLHLD